MRAILTWHSLDESDSVISTTPSLFERQIDVLQRRGVRFVPLAKLPFLPGDDDAVAVTFDDGYTNFATAAAPVLKRRGVTATVFIVTGLIGGTNSWDADVSPNYPHLPLMSRDQIREAFDDGFDIGGHSVTHRSLSGITADALRREVDDCATSIETITGVPPVTFAFPYGAFDERAVDFVARRFPIACTTILDSLTAATSPHALPRLDMHYFRREGLLDHWGTPLFNGYLMARSTGRRIRSVLAGQG